MGGGGDDAQLRQGMNISAPPPDEHARWGRRQWIYLALAFTPLVALSILGFVATR
jgi:hypothetical protein